MTRGQQVEAAITEGEPVRDWVHKTGTTAAQEAVSTSVEVDNYSGFFHFLQSPPSTFHCLNPGGSQLTQKPAGKTRSAAVQCSRSRMKSGQEGEQVRDLGEKTDCYGWIGATSTSALGSDPSVGW